MTDKRLAETIFANKDLSLAVAACAVLPLACVLLPFHALLRHHPSGLAWLAPWVIDAFFGLNLGCGFLALAMFLRVRTSRPAPFGVRAFTLAGFACASFAFQFDPAWVGFGPAGVPAATAPAHHDASDAGVK